MSVHSHIEFLKKKHANLDQKISKIQHAPAADISDLTALKRQKLKLKDEISRLENRPN